MALAGIDFMPYLRAVDPAERLTIETVAAQASDAMQRNRDVERKNLAIEVGSNVGRIVSQALGQLARAMR